MFRRIVLGTDFSDHAMRALAHAVGLAKRTDAALTVVHALALHEYDPALVREGGPLLRKALDRIEADLDERAGAVLAPLLPNEAVDLVFRRGVDAAGVVLEVAEEQGADLVVVGTRGRGVVRHLLLGSVAERVVRGARSPVLVVGGDHDPPLRFHDIVVPVDFSRAARRAAALAGRIAAKDGAQLHAVHVFEQTSPPPFFPNVFDIDDELRARGEKAVADFVLEHAGATDAKTYVREGRAAAEIVAAADAVGAELIVMATLGHAPIAPMALGSVTNAVLRKAQRPVLVSPAPDGDPAWHVADQK